MKFTPEQAAFVRQAIAPGRLHRAEDAIQQADLETGHYSNHAGSSLPLLVSQRRPEARAPRNRKTT